MGLYRDAADTPSPIPMLTDSSIPWIEKYRPTHFDDIVLDPLNRTLFQNILSRKYFPHLLFYGPPGTGKTTTIINLICEFQRTRNATTANTSVSAHPHAGAMGKNRENVIHLNASDERGIDIIRNQINQFVKSNHLFETGMKFVILDEVDYMTKNAQLALKTLIQTSRNNVRFCLICNYISKIEISLLNEFSCIRFNQLPKREIDQFILSIAEKENLHVTPEWIDTIQSMYHSDIRSMINFMQLHLTPTHAGVTKTSFREILSNQTWDQLYHILSCPSETTAKDALMFIHTISSKFNIDKRNLLNSFFNYLVRNHPEIIQKEILDIMGEVVHSIDTPMEYLLRYLIGHFRKQLSACVGHATTTATATPTWQIPTTHNTHAFALSVDR
jgi:replication factor C subunit 3/5